MSAQAHAKLGRLNHVSNRLKKTARGPQTATARARAHSLLALRPPLRFETGSGTPRAADPPSCKMLVLGGEGGGLDPPAAKCSC
eukprot:3056732-Prymnesium_polylepis.1